MAYLGRAWHHALFPATMRGEGAVWGRREQDTGGRLPVQKTSSVGFSVALWLAWWHHSSDETIPALGPQP